MNFKMKTSLLIFFITKYVLLIKASDSSGNYDITKALNDSINGILQMSGWNRVEHLFEKSFEGERSYETKNIRKIKILGDKIMYTNLGFEYGPDANFLSIHWTSSGITTRIQCDNTEYKLEGNMVVEPNKTYIYFSATPLFENVSITITELSTERNNKTIKFDIDYANIVNYETTMLVGCDHLPFKTRQKIRFEVNLMLPKLMRHCLASNKKFRHALKHSLLIYPKQKLITDYPDFSHDEQKYYYLIPKIRLNIFHLENVTIRGLSNFESFNGTSLHVKNINGYMTFNFRKAPIVLMVFEIDHLFISFNRDNQSITVDAQKYKIRQFNFKNSSSRHEALMSSWLREFSPILIRHIESAIANLTMPSMKEADLARTEPCLKACAKDMEYYLGRIMTYETDHFGLNEL